MIDLLLNFDCEANALSEALAAHKVSEKNCFPKQTFSLLLLLSRLSVINKQAQGL